MSWFIITQAGYKVDAVLRDNKTEYFHKWKQSRTIAPPLAQGYSFVEGDSLELVIDVKESKQLKGAPHSSDILNDSGDIVGKEFTLCIEDSDDQDYNDVAVSVFAWKNRG